MRSSVRSRLAPPFGGRTTDVRGRMGVIPEGRPRNPFDAILSVSLKRLERLGVRKAGRPTEPSVLRRPISVLKISDIVKRKRIRSRAGWRDGSWLERPALFQDGAKAVLDMRSLSVVRRLISRRLTPSNQSWVWSLTAQIPGCV